MRIQRQLLPLLLMGLFCSVAMPSAAIEIKRVDTFNVLPQETLEEEHWVAAQQSLLEGAVLDDVFIYAGLLLDIKGTLANDLWGMADEVAFEGQVQDHARFIAAKFRASGGHVGSSLVVLAQEIAIGEGLHVKGDAILIGEDVVFTGTADRNVLIMANSITVKGIIRGKLRLIAEDIKVLPGTEVESDLVYTAPTELFLDSSIPVGGELIRKDLENLADPSPKSWAQFATFKALLFMAALLVALPFVAIFPRYTGRAVRIIRGASWRCMFIGMVVFCLTPMLSMLILFTLIGIPLSLLMLGSLAILTYLCKIVVGLVLGGVILGHRGHQPYGRVLLVLILGMALLYIFTALPVVGSVVWFLVTFLGLGGLILALLGYEVRPVGTVTRTSQGNRPPPLPNAFSKNNSEQSNNNTEA